MKFRKKPVVIEAEQFFAGKSHPKGLCRRYGCGRNIIDFHVHTIHDDQAVFVVDGDWIIPEPDGEHFYPCKPDIFEKTYEPVAEQEQKGDDHEGD